MLSPKLSKSTDCAGIILATVLFLFLGSATAEARVVSAQNSGFGVVKGFVRDVKGNPIIGALVSIFREGSLEAFKQVKSGVDGGFATRLTPGKYILIAAANGFDSASHSSEVSRSSELVFKFNLQPSGSGKTLPERRPDRKGSMWVIRSSQIRRSIYQNNEGGSPSIGDAEVEGADDVALQDEGLNRRSQSLIETYFGTASGRNFTGVNFATFQPVSETAEMVVAGQYGSGSAPMRIETEFKIRPNVSHQVRLSAALAQFSQASSAHDRDLGQLSLQVSDEWRVRKGIVILVGVDYSRFIGSGDSSSLRPRFGVQFEAGPKTRLNGSFTTQTEERNWQSAIDLEGAQVFFREPLSMEDVYLVNGRPVMNRSSRIEFGVERILDSRSSVEADVFLDLTSSRGVGLVNMPIGFLGDADGTFTANQHGRAMGIKAVYSRRLSGRFSTSAGYAYGEGQKLNADASSPSDVFESGLFQTFFGQMDADLLSGTSVKTVFRFSPQATVFAIDPFRGRLAIYDPSLSVLVTQSLPSMGLPIRAEAIVDARNLLDYQTGSGGDETGFKVLSQRRVLRGGIKVRF